MEDEKKYMTMEEARVAIGYDMMSSVLWCLKTGRIRADRNGRIFADSVYKWKDSRDARVESRTLFLNGGSAEDIAAARERERLARKGKKK